MPDLNAMIAVQSRGGMQFGYVRSADEQRIVFEVEAPIAQGEEVDWRMQLIGYPETAAGRCVIDQVSLPQGRWPVFHGRITSMTEADRELYAGWLEDFAEGGTSRRLERMGGEIEQGLLGSLRTQTTALHKIALERMAQRDALRRAIRRKGTTQVDDADTFGLDHESAPAGTWGAEEGRAAVRAAVREITRGTGRGGIGAPRVIAAALPPPAEPEAPAQVVDPAVTVDLQVRPPRVTIRWVGAEVYRDAWTRHLKAGALVVRAPGLAQPGLEVEVVLTPPGAAPLTCRARVSAVLPDGVGFALVLTPELRHDLAAAIRP
jgi:hypothetical protein